MPLLGRPRRVGYTATGLACAAVAFLSAGCGEKPQSANEAIKQQLKANPGTSVKTLGKFEGTVTVDGEPPSTKVKTLIILNDPEKPQNPSESPPLSVGTDKTGHFSASTYVAKDGIRTGKYVVTFVQLHPVGMTGQFGLKGPDELKNLYNDPDVNKTKPEFNIEIKPDVNADFHWDLVVKGKDPVANPGPHAITRIDLHHGGRRPADF